MPRDQATVPTGLVVAVVAALVAGLVGVVFLGLMLRERNAAAGAVSAGGLTLQVQSAQWVDMEHSGQNGFQMPPQMMPGAPSPGQERLAVEVALSNRSGGDTQFLGTEFSIQGLDGHVWPLVADDLDNAAHDSGAADALDGTHVGPGLGVTGTLSFDMPSASASQAKEGLFLLWSHAGKVARVPVTVGEAPAHVHE
jgi:hypothetical protein